MQQPNMLPAGLFADGQNFYMPNNNSAMGEGQPQMSQKLQQKQ